MCYFNSALLWWFEVHTVEINYQSQSRQSDGSCYKLRNWTVKNIHCLHLFHANQNTGKVQIIWSSKLTVIFTWTAGYAWQLEKLHWVTLLTSFPNYLHVDLLVNCTKFKKYIFGLFQNNTGRVWFFYIYAQHSWGLWKLNSSFLWFITFIKNKISIYMCNTSNNNWF